MTSLSLEARQLKPAQIKAQLAEIALSELLGTPLRAEGGGVTTLSHFPVVRPAFVE